MEERIAAKLPHPELYETVKFTYTQEHTYLPDFPINDVLFLECKGYFDAASRSKMLKVKEQNPDKEFVFVFANSRNKLHKKSKITYADWARKHGFRFIDEREDIPEEWLKENGS